MTPYTVAELTQQLETLIGDITPEPVAVRGTLTTWQSSKAWQRGELVTHVDNSIAARITLGCTARHGKAIAWALAVAGYAIEPPVDVTVTGRITLHPQYGLRLQIESIDAATIEEADTRKHRDELVAELEQRGLIERQQTIDIGTIDNIGLITPESGDAGRQDALDILRPLNIPIHERRVQTSGKKAPSSVALAIATLAPATDIIVIVRGGGATSDLHVWDNEAIATAIALCNTPVIVGVGHATDQHIARRVAWHGANTPTAAAQKLADTIRPTPAPVATARNPNITPAAIRASPAPLRGHIDPVPIRSPNRLKWALTAALIVTAVLFSYWLGQQT